MLALNNIKLVVFDLDDTLYREMDFVLGGFKLVAEHLSCNDKEGNHRGLPLHTIYQKMVNLQEAGRRDIFQQILSDLNIPSDQQTIDKLINIYRTRNRELRLFDDAERALIRFRTDGFKLAILTDGFLEAQRAKVRMLDIEGMVDKIVYTDAFGRENWKPAPRGFEILMEYFNTNGNENLYIADNEEKDFLAPNSLNWETLKINRSEGVHHNKLPPTPQHKSQHVLAGLDSLCL